MYRDSTNIKTGDRLVVSGEDSSASCRDLPCLPISNPEFGQMCEVGDSLFVGRYLVNGADQSSLYLEASPLPMKSAMHEHWPLTSDCVRSWSFVPRGSAVLLLCP